MFRIKSGERHCHNMMYWGGGRPLSINRIARECWSSEQCAVITSESRVSYVMCLCVSVCMWCGRWYFCVLINTEYMETFVSILYVKHSHAHEIWTQRYGNACPQWERERERERMGKNWAHHNSLIRATRKNLSTRRYTQKLTTPEQQ